MVEEANTVKTSVEGSIHYSDYNDALYGSTYRWQKQQPFVQPVLSLQSTSQMEIQLPPSVCYNLSRSKLEFDVVAPAVADTYCKFFHMGFAPMIDSVRLYAGSGKELVSLTDVPYVSKMLMGMTTSLEKFLGESSASFNSTTVGSVLEKHHLLHRNDIIPAASDVRGGRIPLALDGSTFSTAGTRYTGISNYVANSTANQAQALRVSIPLGDLFPCTLFALDKDIYTGEVWRLQINFSASQHWGYETKTDVNTLDAPGSANSPRQFSNPCVISNAWVQLAIVDDEVLAGRIKQKTLEEGLTLNMPQLWVERLSTNQTGSFLQTRKYNSGHGKNLCRAWVSVFNSASQSAGLTNFQNNNANGQLFTSIRTQLNQRYLQPGPLVKNDGDIWTYMRGKLEGSCIQAPIDFGHRMVFCDDFSPLKSKDWKASLNKQQGLSLATEQEYGYEVNLATANSYVVLVVQTQRPIKLGSSGTQFL